MWFVFELAVENSPPESLALLNPPAHTVHLSERRSSLILSLVLIAALGIGSVFWGEKIAIHQGFGWDGQIYGTLAREMNFRALGDYSFQRILPSTLVHAALVTLRQPLDNEHIVRAFGLLNLGMMLIACILYREIADELQLGQRGFWFGFAAIFVNFAHCKGIWYCPVVTDPTAMALSLAMLLCYLRGQIVRLLLSTFLGAFTWPTLIYAGTFLLAFRPIPLKEEKSNRPMWLAVALALAVCAWAIVHYYVHDGGVGPGLAQPIAWAMPLSIFLAGLYMYLGSATLLQRMSLTGCLKQVIPSRIILAIALWAACTIPVYLWADHSIDNVTAHRAIRDIVVRSAVKPLGFLVSHPVYFGPAFLMFLFCWRSFSRIVAHYGAGLVAVVLMGVFTSLTPESRQSLPSYVMAAPFLGVLVDELALPPRFFWLFGAVALLSTKVWMRMGLPATDDGQYLSFPMQNLFMNSGVWMNNQMYVIQGGIVLAVAGLFYVHLRQAVKGGVVQPASRME